MDHHIGNYKYSPLREGERRWHTTGDIRILELLPGSFEDPLHCRLRVAAIESDPAYDALSYMWGNPLSPKGRIFLDDELFPVTESLENALRHVRLRDSVRYLWADAVCINQRDIKERGNQVHLMKEIYSRSKTVRAWIDIDLSPENPVVRKLLTLDLEGTIDQLGEDPEFWRILLPLLQDEYWNRLWIQQELVFAPELVFYCRGVDIPGNCLMAFQLQIFRKLTDGMGPFNTDDPWSLFRPLDSTTKAPSRNLACWRAMVEMQVPVDPYTLEPDWSLEKPMAAWALDPRKWGPHLSTSPIYMLGMLRQSQALKLTDSRDRVTAVLNLVIDYEDDGSQADYEQSLAEKYLRVARLLLFKCNGLLFLAVTKTSTNPNDNIQGLPSWAPNWDSPGNAEYFLSAFHAVGDLPMYGTPFQGDMDDGVLYARGFKYATVDQTLSTTNNALTPLWVLLNLFVSTVESAVYHYDDIKKLAFTLTGPAMAELRIPRDYFNENEAVVYTGVLLGHSLVNPDHRRRITFTSHWFFPETYGSAGERPRIPQPPNLSSGVSTSSIASPFMMSGIYAGEATRKYEPVRRSTMGIGQPNSIHISSPEFTRAFPSVMARVVVGTVVGVTFEDMIDARHPEDKVLCTNCIKFPKRSVFTHVS